MRFYCGIDLGSRAAQLCVVDETDRVCLQRNVPCELGAVLEQLERFDPKPEVVVESTFNWYWLVDGLMDRGFDVVLAHVLGLAVITAAKVKTDKRDALTLARLLRLGAIPKAHIYPREQRGARDLLRRRMILVRLRASEYGAIRRLLYRYGVLDHNRHSTKGLTDDALVARFDDPSVKLHAKQEIERLRLYTEQIGTVEAALLAGVQERPDFQRLLTMPGVALMLGLTILYETGPVERFASARHYSSYCRVVPGIGASSGVVRRRGRQSKQGSPTLKWAFNQAATHAVRSYPRIRTYFDRQLAKHVGRAGKLVVYNTVAHKLCVAAFHILRDQVEYKEDLLFAS